MTTTGHPGDSAAGLETTGPRRVAGPCPHDCPDTCAMQVTVENGVAVKVEGAKDHPFTQGTLSSKVSR